MRIAIACDEALAEFMDGFIAYEFERRNKVIKREHITYYDGMFSTSVHKYEMYYKFCDQPERLLRLRPVPGSQHAVAALKQHHELYAFVQRHDDVRDHTVAWLREHYGDVFASVQFMTDKYGSIRPRKKQEACREFGIDLMVEHLIGHAVETASPQRPALLLNKPWNQHQLPSNSIIRCRGWEDAQNYVKMRE